MNREQWNLLARMEPTWGRLWLIADYDEARKYIVGTMHSRSGEVRGTWNETTAKGIRVVSNLRDPVVLLDLPWSDVRDWVRSLSAATVAEAVRLRSIGHEIQGSYPPQYPGIGRQYAWDRKPRGTEAECEKDLADLAEANRKRLLEVDAYFERKAQHERVCRLFLDSLGPGDEPSDLLELLAVSDAR